MRIGNRNREKGVTAIEFALILPIVLVILFGIFEFGFALWRKQELTSAVREGARKGVVLRNPRKPKAEIITVVETYLDKIGMTDSARVVGCIDACPCVDTGDTLTVNVTYPTSFTVISNLSKLFYGSGVEPTKTLTASVSMQCE